MVKKWRALGRIAYGLLVLTVALAAGLAVFSARLFVVRSGSMQPAIPAGSLIAIARQESYRQGEVITYAPGLTTHRIAEVRRTAAGQEFVTKGDANNATDSAAIRKEQISGKVVFVIPYLGYPVGFIKTLPGLIFIIVVPATVIIYQEFLSLKKDIRKLVLRKRAEDEKKKE